MTRLSFLLLLTSIASSSYALSSEEAISFGQNPGLSNPHAGSGSLPKLHRLKSILKRTSSTNCNPGYYYENGCRQCPNGYACPGGSSGRQDCPSGTYAGTGASSCTKCAYGTYQEQQRSTSCKDVQPGWKATASIGATSQTQCGQGYYSPGKTDTCTVCPAGSYCNSQTNGAPNKCQPGRYSPTTGAKQDCLNCPVGTFNNIYGATGCCKCCSGWYVSQTGQTHCYNCPGLGSQKHGSPPGATSPSQCSASLVDYVDSCEQTSASCPVAQNPNPSPKVKRMLRRNKSCPNPQERKCPISVATMDTLDAGQKVSKVVGFGDLEGAYECINVQSNIESCGGCVPPGREWGPDGGRDCTAMEGTGKIDCSRGECIVHSCKDGYRLVLGECRKKNVRRPEDV